MMEESSADTDRNQRLACLRAQRHRAQQRRDNPRRSQRLASQREFEARCHEQESSGRWYQLLCFHSNMAIPLTRANRLAAMRRVMKELHPYSHPAFYVHALVIISLVWEAMCNLRKYCSNRPNLSVAFFIHY